MGKNINNPICINVLNKWIIYRCNTCTCKDDGTTAGCTQIACHEEHHKTKRSPVSNDPASPDFSCVAGS